MSSRTAQRTTFFPGDSEMARRMDEFDWSATLLGPPDSWPHSLQTAVRILLTSRYAMWLGWGPDLIFLYNDAYKPTLGVKHPAALGWPAQQVWNEVWDDIRPRVQTVMKTGTATWDEDLLLFLQRSGYPEETYHTFSYSPLTEDDGTVSGMLCVVTEETARVIGARRLAGLQELSSALASTMSEVGALAAIKRVLVKSSKDLPFTLTYLFKNGGTQARLATRTGMPLDQPAAPRLLETSANKPVWPVDALLQRNAPVLVDDLAARFADLPMGAWAKPPRQALIVPIAQQGQTQPAGFLVAGLNPFRRVDQAYTGFIQLIAGQIAASLANARAADEERKRTDALIEIDRADQALRKSEERYRSLIAQIRDFAIFSSDERGVVKTWNEGCQYVLGYGQHEFIGLDTAELFTAEDRAQDVPAAELRQAREAGTVGTEHWMIARGGRRFFAMGATAALRDSAGRVIGFSTVLRDVTRMKEFQDQLAQRGENLQRLVTERTGELQETTKRLRISERMAALGTLAAGLGHDMGNLLLPMDVRLGLLIEADLPRELHEHVVGIQKCARYLQRLSSGLRLLATDPAHVESRGATDLGRWWADVRIILKDVLPAGTRFEHHLPDSESWVALGRTGLTQAVYNLVQNAADAIKEHGGSRVRVSAEDDASSPWVAIRVADDGPGMTEEVARHCMEPYFSTKARGDSTGMGLALVHAVVTGAGGQVEVESAPGRGTTFSLLLPRALPKETHSDSTDMAGAV